MDESLRVLVVLTGVMAIAAAAAAAAGHSIPSEPSRLSGYETLKLFRETRNTRQQRSPEAVDTLLCIIQAEDQNTSFDNCPPLPSIPGHVPSSTCTCVPYWQCKDENQSVMPVEGDGETSFVLDVRTNLGCLAPEQMCCVDVDLSAPPPTPAPKALTCGQRNQMGIATSFIGFENQQTQFGEFPWSAIIISSRTFGPTNAPLFLGGGSLIHPQVVLSVAHKIYKKNFTAEHLNIRLGEWNLETQTEAVPYQDLEVSEIVFHPEYDNKYFYYDVVLLLLRHPATLGATVNTICLPDVDMPYSSENCIVSGWGKKEFNDNSRFQKVMKKISMPLVDDAQCQAALRNTRLGHRYQLHESFLCAGGQHEGQDACTGDGGSPLVCPLLNDPKRYVEVGAVVGGVGCGRVGVPGIYTDIAKVLPWIKGVISERFGDHGVNQGHTDGVNQEHTDGVNQEHTDGVNQEHTDGVTQEHTDGVTQGHTDGVTHGHTDGVNQEHTDGVTQEHTDGVNQGHTEEEELLDPRIGY